MRRRALAAAAVLVAAAAVLWLARGAVQSPGATGRVERSSDRDARLPRGRARSERLAGALREDALRPAAAEERPASLRGTEVDGALGVAADGSLVVGPDLRRFFDYFLSATGEEPPERLRGRILSEIEARLPPGSAGRARELLDRYLEYRERARDLAASEGRPADLAARWDAIRELRRQVFGDEDAEALFGDEEAEVFVALAERGVGAKPELSPAEREERMDDLAAQLPEAAREARERATAPLRLAREEARLRAEGAGAAEIRALREERFGPAAADRLEELDRRRAEWQRRVDDYRRERAAIEADPVLSPSERSRAVEALATDRFTASERLRVEALDRIAAREGD